METKQFFIFFICLLPLVKGDERANLATFIQWAASDKNVTNTSTPEKQIVISTEIPIPSSVHQPTTPISQQNQTEVSSGHKNEVEVIEGSSPPREVVYVIREGAGGTSGTITGIIKEALGLVQNTIRVVGLNINLLAGPSNLRDSVLLARLNATKQQVTVEKKSDENMQSSKSFKF